MKSYRIKKERLPIAGPFVIEFAGVVNVDYPAAHISITASASLCKNYTYRLKLDPNIDVFESKKWHSWTFSNYWVAVEASINRAAPRTVKVKVIDGNGKTHWSDSFDLYGPYKKRKVEAFAQPAFVKPISEWADHTYGAGFGDDGARTYLWPCGGDHDGDGHRRIASGEAFLPECDCLSQRLTDPVTKGLAGILYGIDGVCHQATNRLLCPAGVEVTDAWGYQRKGLKNLSYAMYGRLGLRHANGRHKWDSIKRGCLERECHFCDEASFDEEFRRFGGEAPTEELQMIDATAQRYSETHVAHFEAVATGDITPREFADRMNASISDFADELKNTLASDTYESLFGDLPKTIVLVEPEICEAIYGRD